MADPVVAAVEEAIGSPIVALHPPPGSGYTPARRFVAELGDGRRVFVKAAPDAHIGGWIDREIDTYRTLRAACMPEMVAATTAGPGDLPVIVLEDLSGAHWPPPWTDEQVAAVLDVLDDVHGLDPPPTLPTVGRLHPDLRAGWDEVSRHPPVLVDTGLCSPEWLDGAIAHFRDRASAAVLDGDTPCHLDVRSDNLCFVDDGSVRLVDWNHACRADPGLDPAFWLPSLAAETGRRPDDLAQVATETAVVVAGFFAARAGLPAISKAPRVREVQLAQLAVALPWAARLCGFEAPLGSDAA